MVIALNPILHPNMDILFVPLNPPVTSNSNGHFFSSNHSFWNVLYDAGLLLQPINSLLTADEEVFKYGKNNFRKAVYGICDLVQVIETNSTKVKTKPEDVQRILGFINEFGTKNICLMHSKVREAFINTGMITSYPDYGLVGTYRNSKIFAVPFPSGTNLSKEKIVRWYSVLKEQLVQTIT